MKTKEEVIRDALKYLNDIFPNEKVKAVKNILRIDKVVRTVVREVRWKDYIVSISMNTYVLEILIFKGADVVTTYIYEENNNEIK